MPQDDDGKAQDRPAADLISGVYRQLKALAASYLRNRPSNSLEPTGLVHEAYIRLAKSEQATWSSRTHFFAVAATQMRRVLVDHARRRLSLKRAGEQVTLVDNHTLLENRTLDILALDEALERLAQRSERQVKVAELRVFAGLTVAETAEALGVSERTIKYDWRFARAWLARHLGSDSK